MADQTAEEKAAAEAAAAAEKGKGDAGAGGSDEHKGYVPESIYSDTKRDMLTYKERMRAAEAKLTEIETQQAESKKKAQEEQGQFKELYETEKTTNEDLRLQINDMMITNAVRAEAAQMGALNLNDRNFERLAGVEIKEGQVIGVKDALAKLKETAPYLFGEAAGSGDDGKGGSEKPPPSAQHRPGAARADSVEYEELLKDTAKLAKFKKEHPARFNQMREAWRENRQYGPRRQKQ